MNTFTIAPDVRPEFGDEVLETARQVVAKDDVETLAKLSGMCRTFVRVAVQCQCMEALPNEFSGSVFLGRVNGDREVEEKLLGAMKLAVSSCKHVHTSVTSCLTMFSTLGMTHLRLCLELMECAMHSGCLLVRTCERLGSEGAPDVDWKGFEQQLSELTLRIDHVKRKLSGAMLAAPPKEVSFPCAIRAWMAVVCMCISTFVSFGILPEALLVMDHTRDTEREGTQLLLSCRRIIEVAMTGSFKQAQPEIITVASKPLETYPYSWERVTNFFNRMNSVLKDQMWLRRVGGSQGLTKVTERSQDDDSDSESDDGMGHVNQLSPRSQKRWWWALRKTVDGAGPDHEPSQANIATMFPMFSVPKRLTALLAIDRVVQKELSKATFTLKEATRRDLNRIDEMNIPEEKRMNLRNTVLGAYAQAEDQIKETLGYNPDNIKREINKARILWQADPQWETVDMVQRSFEEVFGGQKEEVVADSKEKPTRVDSLRTLFSQDAVVDDLYASYVERMLKEAESESQPQEQLEKGMVELEQRMRLSGGFQSPLQTAMQTLLGPRPEAPTHVVLTSEGSVPLSPTVASLASLIALSILIVPGSGSLLRMDDDSIMRSIHDAIQQ